MKTNQPLLHDHFLFDSGKILKRHFLDAWGGSNNESYFRDQIAATFGEYIRDIRDMHDLSRAELSAASKIPVAEIAAIENGLIIHTRIKDRSLLALATALDEDVETFELLLDRPIKVAVQSSISVVRYQSSILSAFLGSKRLALMFMLVALALLFVFVYLIVSSGSISSSSPNTVIPTTVDVEMEPDALHSYIPNAANAIGFYQPSSSSIHELEPTSSLLFEKIIAIVVTTMFLIWVLIRWELPNQLLQPIVTYLRSKDLQLLNITVSYSAIFILGLTLILIFHNNSTQIASFTQVSFNKRPSEFTYTGMLEKNGNSVNGTYDMTIRIYDDEVRTNTLFVQSYTGVVIDQGNFSLNIELHEVSADIIADGFIGVTLEPFDEMVPLNRLNLSPFSARAFPISANYGSVPLNNSTTESDFPVVPQSPVQILIPLQSDTVQSSSVSSELTTFLDELAILAINENVAKPYHARKGMMWGYSQDFSEMQEVPTRFQYDTPELALEQNSMGVSAFWYDDRDSDGALSVAWDDIDRDGELDLSASKIDPDEYSIYLNQGSRGFQLSSSLGIKPNQSQSWVEIEQDQFLTVWSEDLQAPGLSVGWNSLGYPVSIGTHRGLRVSDSNTIVYGNYVQTDLNIAWTDLNFDTSSVYPQKIESNGNTIWTNRGNVWVIVPVEITGLSFYSPPLSRGSTILGDFNGDSKTDLDTFVHRGLVIDHLELLKINANRTLNLSNSSRRFLFVQVLIMLTTFGIMFSHAQRRGRITLAKLKNGDWAKRSERHT